MKEIIAVIRPNKIQKTKNLLAEAGFPSLTVNRVLGRGKQRGLQFEFTPLTITPEDAEKVKQEQVISKYSDSLGVEEGGVASYIPKRMVSIAVPDESVQKVVQLLIKANQTGNIGDGKIFVCPLKEAIRIRTAEKGDEALV